MGRMGYLGKGSAILLIGMMAGPGVRAQIPILDIISFVSKKVVVALDLKVQELQTQTIELQAAEKELENEMEDSELGDIFGWVKGQEQLYAEYYQELWQVKAAISGYTRITAMIDKEAQIVQEYQRMSSALRADGQLTATEVESMTASLAAIMNESVNNLGQLQLVITAFLTQMPDAGRLQLVDEIGTAIDQNYAAMQGMYQSGLVLSLNRARTENDIQAVKGLWGVQ